MPKKTTDPVELLTEQIKARLNALIHTEDTTSLQAVVNGLDLLLEDQKQSKSKLDGVLEGYKPVRLGRMFYPRNFQLSEDFINSFHREYDRLVGEGQNSRSLVERFGKAMKFHVNDSRKYRQLDEKNKDDKDDKDDKESYGHGNLGRAYEGPSHFQPKKTAKKDKGGNKKEAAIMNKMKGYENPDQLRKQAGD